MKQQGLPIYGLACPGKIVNTSYLSPKEKKCGCIKSGSTEQSLIKYGYRENTLADVGSQIFNNVTGSPFEAQTVHVLNLNNGEATVTKPDGYFVIRAQPTDNLKITHVGYGELIIKASDLTDKIVLKESTEVLDEIVIGPKKKGVYALLGLAAVFAIVYVSADEEKKAS